MTRALIRSSLLLLPLTLGAGLIACGDKDDEDDTGSGHKGDDTGGGDVSGTPYCEETRTSLAMDEASPLGFSAMDVITGIGEDVPAELTWAKDGGTTGLLIEVHVEGVEFVDQEVVVPDSGAVADIYVECPDYLAMQTGLQLETEDGLLEDAVSTELRATEAVAAEFSERLPLDAFDHPEIFAHVDTTDADVVEATVSGVFRGGGTTSGELAVWMEGGSDGDDGDVGTAWAGTEPVATWSSEGDG